MPQLGDYYAGVFHKHCTSLIDDFNIKAGSIHEAVQQAALQHNDETLITLKAMGPPCPHGIRKETYAVFESSHREYRVVAFQ